MTARLGEIWYGYVGPERKRRVIIVSREELNRGAYATIVPITSRRFELRKKLPNCVPLFAGRFGLTKNCVAQAENITLVRHSDLDFESGPLAELDAITLRAVVKAIGNVIGADCEMI
ncbi:MAG TPA: type II toxin-antitoxin system PemK/MazF family toxin [Phycisphaerae bacterium]|nr:type II toxin-antitoxin system PemK/MazF family toxin [Phycisphaerae bacterium]